MRVFLGYRNGMNSDERTGELEYLDFTAKEVNRFLA